MELKRCIDNTYKALQESFNRTLWNWNNKRIISRPRLRGLLIVPYGIETIKKVATCCPLVSFNRTLWNWNHHRSPQIHNPCTAFNRTLWNWNSTVAADPFPVLVLLIVPYGIETSGQIPLDMVALWAFNRTLWNWNSPQFGDTAIAAPF